MRIITGNARGAKLETLDGIDTRPTAERVKEAVFSMIQFELEGRQVLDLFGGSGQMGLEALSRGAAKATFVDNNPEAVQIIKKNAKHTGLFEKSVVLNSDFRSFIRGNKGRMQFDIVFLDPPYAMKVLHETVEKLEEAEMIREKGIVICESDDPTPIEVAGYSLRRHARYGRVYITVLVKEGGEEDAE
ncbi:MAG: 16S rRNA (guanine(966)-N(2))-methyltransferase RsmD [Ruminococcaceae bacterium]|nr:16S rRNA (guanine(966)-N(2))-methyltransferase RsmD [Oscillospiraceae bacterium]